jgi:hypothetical protein
MTATARELLTRLLDVTPAPLPDTAVEALLTAFETIVAQRAVILAGVAAPITLSEMDRPLLVELQRRQNIWQDALGAALRLIGDQRVAATQLRAYAGPR